MIVGTNRTRILCFGDSNTWGRDPVSLRRYPIDVRWPGVLQVLLGDKYDVIEEGLGGRTVNQDANGKIDKNGRTYLTPCIESHTPIDSIIIMLGTNDLKSQFRSTPQSITDGLSALVDDVYAVFDNNGDKRPEIVLISPAHIDVKNPEFSRIYGHAYNISCGELSHQLAEPINQLCQQRGLSFINAQDHTSAGQDGLHLTASSHRNLAQAIKNTIEELPQ